MTVTVAVLPPAPVPFISGWVPFSLGVAGATVSTVNVARLGLAAMALPAKSFTWLAARATVYMSWAPATPQLLSPEGAVIVYCTALPPTGDFAVTVAPLLTVRFDTDRLAGSSPATALA